MTYEDLIAADVSAFRDFLERIEMGEIFSNACARERAVSILRRYIRTYGRA